MFETSSIGRVFDTVSLDINLLISYIYLLIGLHVNFENRAWDLTWAESIKNLLKISKDKKVTTTRTIIIITTSK